MKFAFDKILVATCAFHDELANNSGSNGNQGENLAVQTKVRRALSFIDLVRLSSRRSRMAKVLCAKTEFVRTTAYQP